MLGLRKHHREQLRRQPFPDARLRILEENVPYYRGLSSADQEKLRGHCLVFLDEKHFEELSLYYQQDPAAQLAEGDSCNMTHR